MENERRAPIPRDRNSRPRPTSGSDEAPVDFKAVGHMCQLSRFIEIIRRQAGEMVADLEKRLGSIVLLKQFRRMSAHHRMHLVAVRVAIPLQQPPILQFLEAASNAVTACDTRCWQNTHSAILDTDDKPSASRYLFGPSPSLRRQVFHPNARLDRSAFHFRRSRRQERIEHRQRVVRRVLGDHRDAAQQLSRLLVKTTAAHNGGYACSAA